MNIGKDVTSLDELLFDDTEKTFIDSLVDENNVDPLRNLATENIEENLNQCLDQLDLKQKGVLMRRFGIGGYSKCTLDEVSDQMGLTRERVRQIQENGLRKMHNIYVILGCGHEAIEDRNNCYLSRFAYNMTMLLLTYDIMKIKVCFIFLIGLLLLSCQ